MPTADSNALSFREDGTFRVLQVSDPQDLVHPRRAMLKMLDAAYDAFSPDLVLFTGDNTLGNHLLDVGPFRIQSVRNSDFTLRQMRRALKRILLPVDQRNVPFAMIYGNHDDMNDVTKEAQFALYRAYSSCLPMNETDPAVDCDTYHIPIRTRDGKTAWNLWLLDSAWNDETGQYWKIREETVQWYARTSASLAEENGGTPVPSLMFMHVPLPQTKDLLIPCAETEPGAMWDGVRFVRLDSEKASGVLGESISAGEDPFGLYEAVRRRGDVRAFVFGHDHRNCFDGVSDGMRFIQSGAASFRCYGAKETRGVRLFTLHADDPDSFETAYYTYMDLCGDDALSRLRYFWDADESARKKYTLLGAGAVLAAAGTAIGLLTAHLKK